MAFKSKKLDYFFKPLHSSDNNVSSSSSSTTDINVVPSDENGANTTTNTSTSTGPNVKPRPANESTETRPKKRKADKFQSNWLKIWPWLRYEKGEMFCATCKEARSTDTSNFVSEGSRDFKTSALRRHAVSRSHAYSLQATKTKKLKPLEKHAIKVIETKEQGVISALKTTYFMAKRHIANHLHRDIMDFLRFQHSPEAALLPEGTYSHHKSQDEMQEAICSVIEEGIKEKLLNSDFIGVIIDESTDVSVSKTLIVYMTLINCGKRETHFVKNVEIKGGTADIVAAKVKEICQDLGVDTMKVMGFGSDGASVMMGKRGGVVAKLKAENPSLIGIHCVAHRLSLVTSQASKGIRYMQEYERKLGTLFAYFHNSPARMKTLKEIETLLSEDSLRIAGLHSVRWLSMRNAVTSVHRIYASILVALEHDSDNPTAKGLHSFFEKSTALLVTAYLRDVLGSIAILSKVFQRQNLTLTTVNPMIESTRCCIRSMENLPAQFEQETRDELNRNETEHGDCEYQVDYKGASIKYSAAMVGQVDTLKATFTNNIMNNLEERFPSEDVSVTSSFQVLDPKNMGMLPSAAVQLQEYGSSSINLLAEHFASVLQDSEVLIKEEFPLFKQLLVSNYLSFTFEEMAEKVINDMNVEFPNIGILYKIALILPVSSAACERGFSVQNIIKNNHRNRLSTESVNRLTTIAVEGPAYRQFDYQKALLKWKSLRQRQYFPNVTCQVSSDSQCPSRKQ